MIKGKMKSANGIRQYMRFFIFLLYFTSSPFIAAFKYHKRGDRKRSPFSIWIDDLTAFFRLNFRVMEGSKEVEKGRIIYLLNHRSWADFFVHSYILGGEVSYLSRALVAVIFPSMLLANYKTKRLWLFNRAKMQNSGIYRFLKKFPLKKGVTFYTWLDRCFSESSNLNGGSLIVYPEGHRNTKSTPLPVKYGMIRYAYKRKIPIQIVICKGTERIIAEKEMRISKDEVIEYKVFSVFKPENYKSCKKMVEDVEKHFSDSFLDVYSKSNSE